MAEERHQRRLAAILAADVAGYSRLMERDEGGTLNRLKALQRDVFGPKTKEFGGRIFKTTGDGALVEFKSAVDAVKCATDIQRAFGMRNEGVAETERIELRIGISLGDVIVEGSDLYGNGVNVAARMQGLAAPGGICISGNVHEQVRGTAGLVFDDLGEQQVKNIDRPVRAVRVGAGAETSTTSPGPEIDAVFQRPAIAVLPFENLSGDPEQEYFADGLTEDVITALSLWRTFPVIARNSTFAYKSRSPDIRQVGKELGARYVIEGSVRKSGNRVRVTAQLIDAESGHHVWARRYDRDLKDIFDLQDDLTQRIVATVEPQLEHAEFQRSSASAPENLAAWDFVQRGWYHVDQFTREGCVQARKMFDRALEIDPAYVPALVGTARSHYVDVRFAFTDDPEGTLSKIFEAASKAVELDNMDPKAHWVMGLYHLLSQQYDLAIAEQERAIELNPSFAYAHFTLGATMTYVRRLDEAYSYLHKAIDLNPLDPRIFNTYFVLSSAHFAAHDYDKTIEWAKKAIQTRADWVESRLLLIAALGYLGRDREAKAAIEDCRHFNIDLTQALRGPLAFQELRSDLLEGLKRAGWTD